MWLQVLEDLTQELAADEEVKHVLVWPLRFLGLFWQGNLIVGLLEEQAGGA
jgi:hypothetical protein